MIVKIKNGICFSVIKYMDMTCTIYRPTVEYMQPVYTPCMQYLKLTSATSDKTLSSTIR